MTLTDNTDDDDDDDDDDNDNDNDDNDNDDNDNDNNDNDTLNALTTLEIRDSYSQRWSKTVGLRLDGGQRLSPKASSTTSLKDRERERERGGGRRLNKAQPLNI